MNVLILYPALYFGVIVFDDLLTLPLLVSVFGRMSLIKHDSRTCIDNRIAKLKIKDQKREVVHFVETGPFLTLVQERALSLFSGNSSLT